MVNSENLKRINNKKVIKCTNKLINLSKITNFLWRLFVFGYELRKRIVISYYVAQDILLASLIVKSLNISEYITVRSK